MTNREFNKWLEGFLETCEVNDVSELSGEKLSIVVQKFKNVKNDVGWILHSKFYSTFKGVKI